MLKRRLTIVILSFVLLLIQACGSDKTEEGMEASGERSLDSVSLYNDYGNNNIPLERPVNFRLRKNYTDGSSVDFTESEIQTILWSYDPPVDTTQDANQFTWSSIGTNTLSAQVYLESKAFTVSENINIVEPELSEIIVKQIVTPANSGCTNNIPVSDFLVKKCLMQFEAQGVYNNFKTADITTEVIWSSANTDLVDFIHDQPDVYSNAQSGVKTYITTTLDGTTDIGFAYGKNVPSGTFNVSASQGAITGTTETGKFRLIDPELYSFSVNAAGPIIEKSTYQFTARAVFTNDTTSDESKMFSWSSVDSDISFDPTLGKGEAIVNNINSDKFVTITASDGITNENATVDLVVETLVDLKIETGFPTLEWEQEYNLVAKGIFTNSGGTYREIDCSEDGSGEYDCNWTVTDGSLLVIDQKTGKITANTLDGSTDVTVSLLGDSNNETVTIKSDTVLKELHISAPSGSYWADQIFPMSIIGLFEDKMIDVSKLANLKQYQDNGIDTTDDAATNILSITETGTANNIEGGFNSIGSDKNILLHSTSTTYPDVSSDQFSIAVSAPKIVKIEIVPLTSTTIQSGFSSQFQVVGLTRGDLAKQFTPEILDINTVTWTADPGITLDALTHRNILIIDTTTDIIASDIHLKAVHKTYGDASHDLNLSIKPRLTVTDDKTNNENLNEGANTTITLTTTELNDRDIIIPFRVIDTSTDNSLDYIINQSATSDISVVRIPAGNATGSLTIDTVNDAIFEKSESFTIEIAQMFNNVSKQQPDAEIIANFDTSKFITYTILDNDPMPVLSFEETTITVLDKKDASTDIHYTAKLDTVSGENVTFNLSGNPVTSAALNYQLPGLISINKGDTTTDIKIGLPQDILNDASDDVDILLSIADLTNATTASDDTYTIGIVNPRLISFEDSSADIIRDLQVNKVRVLLNKAGALDVTGDIDISPVASTDYTFETSNITFAINAGDTSTDLTYTIDFNETIYADQNITLTLENTSNGEVTPGKGTHQLKIKRAAGIADLASGEPYNYELTTATTPLINKTFSDYQILERPFWMSGVSSPGDYLINNIARVDYTTLSDATHDKIQICSDSTSDCTLPFTITVKLCTSNQGGSLFLPGTFAFDRCGSMINDIRVQHLLNWPSSGTSDSFEGNIFLDSGTLQLDKSASFTGDLDIRNNGTIHLNGDVTADYQGSFQPLTKNLNITGVAGQQSFFDNSSDIIIDSTGNLILTDAIINSVQLQSGFITANNDNRIINLKLPDTTSNVEIVTNGDLIVDSIDNDNQTTALRLSGNGRLYLPNGFNFGAKGKLISEGPGTLEIDNFDLSTVDASFDTDNRPIIKLNGTITTGTFNIENTELIANGTLFLDPSTVDSNAATDIFIHENQQLVLNGTGGQIINGAMHLGGNLDISTDVTISGLIFDASGDSPKINIAENTDLSIKENATIPNAITLELPKKGTLLLKDSFILDGGLYLSGTGTLQLASEFVHQGILNIGVGTLDITSPGARLDLHNSLNLKNAIFNTNTTDSILAVSGDVSLLTQTATNIAVLDQLAATNLTLNNNLTIHKSHSDYIAIDASPDTDVVLTLPAFVDASNDLDIHFTGNDTTNDILKLQGVFSRSDLTLSTARLELTGPLSIINSNIDSKADTYWGITGKPLSWDGKSTPSPLGIFNIEGGGKLEIIGDSTIGVQCRLNSGSTLSILADVTLTTTPDVRQNTTLDVQEDNTLSLNVDVFTGSQVVTLTGKGDILTEQENEVGALVVNQPSGQLLFNSQNGFLKKAKVIDTSPDIASDIHLHAEEDFTIEHLFLHSRANIKVDTNKTLNILNIHAMDSDAVLYRDRTVDTSGDLILHDINLSAKFKLAGNGYTLAPDATLHAVNTAVFDIKAWEQKDIFFKDGLIIEAGAHLTIDATTDQTIYFEGGVIIGTGGWIEVDGGTLDFSNAFVDADTWTRIKLSGTGIIVGHPDNISGVDAITNFKAVPLDENRIRLTWDKPDATRYDGVMIKRSSSKFFDNSTDIADMDYFFTSLDATTDTNLEPGKMYFYSAFSYNNDVYETHPVKAVAAPTYEPGGLVAYYPLDTTPGSTEFYLMDGSGNKNHGMFLSNDGNDATDDITYQSDKAFAFDGTQFMEINNPLIPLEYESSGVSGDVNTDFSISLWYKTTSTAGDSSSDWRLGKGLVSGAIGEGNDDFGITSTNGYIMFGIGEVTINSLKPINDGRWYNITATRSGTAMKLYINGVEAADGTSSIDQPLTSANTLYIGATAFNDGHFTGVIDEVRFYGKELNSTAVKLLYNNYMGIRAYYKLDGNAQDDSGNDYHGIPHNVSRLSSAEGKDGLADTAISFTRNGNFTTSLPVDPSRMNEMTITMWVNITSATIWQTYSIIGTSNESRGLKIYNPSSRILRIKDSSDYSGSISFSLNTWYPIVVIYNKISSNGKLIVKDLQQTVTNNLDLGLETLVMGSTNYINSSFVLDEVHIYNRILSAEEIEYFKNDVQ